LVSFFVDTKIAKAESRTKFIWFCRGGVSKAKPTAGFRGELRTPAPNFFLPLCPLAEKSYLCSTYETSRQAERRAELVRAVPGRENVEGNSMLADLLI